MPTSPPAHSSGRTSSEIANAANNLCFFQGYSWAATECERELSECSTCQVFSACGIHDTLCAVYEMETRLMENVVAESERIEETAQLRDAAAELKKVKTELAWQVEEQVQHIKELSEKYKAVERKAAKDLSLKDRVIKALSQELASANQSAVDAQNLNDELIQQIQHLEASLAEAHQQLEEHQEDTPEQKQARLLREENEAIEELRRNIEKSKTSNAKKGEYLLGQQDHLRQLEAEQSSREPLQEFSFKQAKGKGRKK